MNQIREFIQWLSFHPTSDDIARSLATDYLDEFSALGIRFSRLLTDESIIILGQFGFEDSAMWADRVIPSSEWRARDIELAHVLKGETQENWFNDSTVYIRRLRDHGMTQGHLMVTFRTSVKECDRDRVAEIIQDLCLPLSLYLSFQSRGPVSKVVSLTAKNDNPNAGGGQLTPRQLSILRGMVEGKTNHEMATEMRYSVSTIRHETMRIYRALAASDRKEAAKRALMLSLV